MTPEAGVDTRNVVDGAAAVAFGRPFAAAYTVRSAGDTWLRHLNLIPETTTANLDGQCGNENR